MESHSETTARHKTKRSNASASINKSLDSPSGGSSKSNQNSSTGRPPTTTMLRSAMYYQNRIIVPEVKTRPYQPNAYQSAMGGPTGAYSSSSSQFNKLPSTQTSDPNARRSTSPDSEFSNSAINRRSDAGVPASGRATDRLHNQYSAATGYGNPDAEMDPRGVDIVVTDTDGHKQHKVKKKTIWHRIWSCLQDNRMKGNPNAELILAGSNPREYFILKRVLNIIFLTIGIGLLISVVIVIIYTTV